MRLSKNNSETVITDFVSRIQEAENILRYAFHLNDAFKMHPKCPSQIMQNPSDISDLLNNYIETIIKDCHTFFNVSECNFFGFKGSSVNKEDDLSILCMRSSFWKHVIKQDVILFAFNTLRKVIGEGFVLSPSEIVLLSNYTLTTLDDSELYDKCHYGFDYLTTTTIDGKANGLPLLSLSVNGPKALSLSYNNRRLIKNIESRTNFAPIASNSKRRINHIYRNITQKSKLDLQSLYLIPDDVAESKSEQESSAYVTLSTFEFYDFIVTRRKPSANINSILDAFIQKKHILSINYKNYISSVNRLLASIGAKDIDKDYIQYSSDSNSKLLMSDRIYLRYQIEKIFAPSTISCLYQNISATQGTAYSLCDQPTIETLASCLRLPNVFTRHYIFQMAVDIISKHYGCKFHASNFFKNAQESPNALMTYADSNTSYLDKFFKLDAWKANYRHFITYLMQMVFPIYENYFFCSIWDLLKADNPDATDAERVKKMYGLFRDYLNNPDNTCELFSTEDKIIHADPALSGFDSNCIIHPVLAYDIKDLNSINSELYKNCLIAHTLTFSSDAKLVPDFLNMDYLNSLSKTLKRKIQNIYILECSGYYV